MTHEDQMRSLRLMGEEVLPAVREIGKELKLFGPFEVDPATSERLDQNGGSGSGNGASCGAPDG